VIELLPTHPQMGNIEFRDWFPPLVAALLGGSFGALIGGLVGWWGNARVQREARIARVQMERKREIYQPLHREVVESVNSLAGQPFPRPSELISDPNRGPTYVHPSAPDAHLHAGQAQEYPALPPPSCSHWIALQREGRNAEVSAEIVQAFARILHARSAYLGTFYRVQNKWFKHAESCAARENQEQPPRPLLHGAVDALFYHVLEGLEITDSKPDYALRHTVFASALSGRQLVQSIPNADADVAEVQAAALALEEAFTSAQAALEKKIRHITEKYEGG